MPNTKVAKQVIRRIHKAWIGYRQAHKDWQKSPGKYLGEPKIPKYKHKEKGRYMLVFPIETISKPYLRKGILKLTPCPIEIKTGLEQVVETKVIPRSGCYVLEVVYEQNELEKKLGDVVALHMCGMIEM